MSMPVIVLGCQEAIFNVAPTSDTSCPPTYFSAELTGTCPGGTSGGPFTLPQGRFTSQLSQADADAQAQVLMNTILTNGCVLVPKPVVTSAGANIGNNVAFSYQILATNSPTSYGATGLPTGLSIDTTTGVISGTITGQTLGHQFTIPISATNAGGTGNGTLILTVVGTASVTLTTLFNIGTSPIYEVAADGASYAPVVSGTSYNFVNRIKYRMTLVAEVHQNGACRLQYAFSNPNGRTISSSGSLSTANAVISSAGQSDATTYLLPLLSNSQSLADTTGNISVTEPESGTIPTSSTGQLFVGFQYGQDYTITSGVFETILNLV